MAGKIEKEIMRKLGKRKLHFSLIDPDPQKASTEKIKSMADELSRIGTDTILVGGSTRVTESVLDRAIKTVKRSCSFPVILYPGSAGGLSRYADAILFMSLLNSSDPLWISGMQARGAPAVKKYHLETIPMAYLIVEPGMKAGEMGKARLLSRQKPEEAASYALAAQYMGMRFVYLEAGSGAPEPVNAETIKAVRKSIGVPLIVGGGIRSAEQAKNTLRAGADIIVTGTIIEDDIARAEDIIRTVKRFR